MLSDNDLMNVRGFWADEIGHTMDEIVEALKDFGVSCELFKSQIRLCSFDWSLELWML